MAVTAPLYALLFPEGGKTIGYLVRIFLSYELAKAVAQRFQQKWAGQHPRLAGRSD